MITYILTISVNYISNEGFLVKKRFRTEEIAKLEYLSEPTAAPNGSVFAYVKSVADETLDGFVSDIYLYQREAKEQKKLHGEGGKRSPAWSPDGKYLAYLSEANGLFQIWILDTQSGEQKQLTTMRHGVETFAWSPDSLSVAFQCKLYPDELEKKTDAIAMTAEECAQWQAEKAQEPIEITELIYKYDGEGLLDGSRQAVGVADIISRQIHLLSADIPSMLPAWSPDGKMLAFYALPYTGAKARSVALFTCLSDGSDRKQRTEGLFIGGESPPCFTKDSSAVIVDVYPDLPDGGLVQSLYSVPLDGSEPEELFNRDASDYMGINGFPISRTFYGQSSPLFTLSHDGEWVYYLLASHGAAGVHRLNISTRITEHVVSGKFGVQSFCLTSDDAVLSIMGEPDRIAELFFDGEQLTQSNRWLEDYQIAPVREISVPTRDGKATIQGWVMSPVFVEEGVKVPAVLEIRGGPETTSVADFWHEYQALAGAGMAVIYCNPRGSLGYGPAFMHNNAAWDLAPDDLLDFVDAAVALGFIDKKRIGVTGGSYGGYMTNKLICETEVFAAAAAQRTLCNLCTSYGTGDIGFVSAKGPLPDQFKMLDYMTDRAKRSLICQIDQIKVPVLLLHGYEDYRCSFEQSEQFFVAMKERHPNIPVRLGHVPWGRPQHTPHRNARKPDTAPVGARRLVPKIPDG